MEKGQWIGRYRDTTLAERLHDLYWTQNLSVEKIAEIEGVKPSTVHRRMIKLGIPRRTPHDWHHVNVNLGPTEELAYILGVLLGDGMVSGRRIRLRTVDFSFAESFYTTLQNLGFRPRLTVEENGGFGNKPLHVATGCSVDFVNWFKSLTITDIEKIVMKSANFAREFIRGFYESEGHLNIEKHGNPRAYMYNTDRDIVHLVAKAMDYIGFKAHIQGPYLNGEAHKPIFYIQVPRPTSLNLIEEISPCIKGGI